MENSKMPGPSCDLEEDGDPKREGYGARLARDLAVERTVDTTLPGYANTPNRYKVKPWPTKKRNPRSRRPR